MRFIGVRLASFESWLTGTVLAAFHLAVVAVLIWVGARGSRDAQWDLIFMPLLLLDLPVAWLGYPLGLGVAWALKAIGLPLDPKFVVIAIASGVVGSAFYLLLPPAISAHRRFRREAV